MYKDKKLQFLIYLKNILILSSQLEKNFAYMIRYIDLALEEKSRVIFVINRLIKTDKDPDYLVKIKNYIKENKLVLVEIDDILKDIDKIQQIEKESKRLGFDKIKLMIWSPKNIEKKINILQYADRYGYDYFCYYNVADLSVEQILDMSSYYKAIVFEDEKDIEIYSNKKIKELRLILESLRESVETKKKTYENVKALEKLNKFLVNVNKIEEIDKFLEEFLEFLVQTTGAYGGGILKYYNEKFQVCHYITYKIDEIEYIHFDENEGIKTIYIDNKKVVLLNIGQYTNIYIVLKSIYKDENDDIFKIATYCARNIVNAFLEKAKNDSILIQNEKLNALGEIASGIVHDFNNILASISGYVSLCLVKSDNQIIKEYLEVIRKACLDGAEMLKRIQEFTKSSRSHEKQVFNINAAIETALSMIKTKLSEKRLCGVNISILKDFRSSDNIKGRESGIREVIINILNNAIDAMPESGNIKITTHNTSEYVIVEIEDTGVGMSKDVLSKIFDPFFSTKGVNGNGIGLSVSYKIIKDHNGDIKAESKEGAGSKFIITLPREHEEFIQTKNINETLAKFNFKLLVVDDKVAVAKATGEILKNIVQKVDICFSGKEALSKIEINNYDIVISDLAMPGMNGIELAKIVKEKYPHLKFVIMTGWLGDIDECKETIIEHILEKPFGIDEVTKILEQFNQEENNG
ncbi:Signal transduction histidine kinase [Alkalithermobacter thermoalcaliphilus JW-YL-7 = DSM 7308]|uniref:Stage 0 sporulation protein A homolog n=1 Tax=Alkalithermobacter thermoalcaliphilus JW-YL-7 = DSM 7308 TaxID=1121328 RepID=A0A150FNB9_CLOPD|nr:histidine kinase [[Clostridium] paradoxum JW-YL-7 = DSM 7308]SHL06590.1 Signal transduction histidine kinase [[Clostridium] paradoxum JW-YL-7 = DSM 7308]